MESYHYNTYNIQFIYLILNFMDEVLINNQPQFDRICQKMKRLLIKKQKLSQSTPQQISPGLYISNYSFAINKNFIIANKISLIITCVKIEEKDKVKEANYRQLIDKDKPEENISQYFDWFFDLVSGHLNANPGGKCLVNCFSGKSRSVALAISYLIKSKNINYQQAYLIAKQKHPNSQPNSGFINQLKQYAEKTVKVAQNKNVQRQQQEIDNSRINNKKQDNNIDLLDLNQQPTQTIKKQQPFPQQAQKQIQITSQTQPEPLPLPEPQLQPQSLTKKPQHPSQDPNSQEQSPQILNQQLKQLETTPPEKQDTGSNGESQRFQLLESAKDNADEKIIEVVRNEDQGEAVEGGAEGPEGVAKDIGEPDELKETKEVGNVVIQAVESNVQKKQSDQSVQVKIEGQIQRQGKDQKQKQTQKQKQKQDQNNNSQGQQKQQNLVTTSEPRKKKKKNKKKKV